MSVSARQAPLAADVAPVPPVPTPRKRTRAAAGGRHRRLLGVLGVVSVLGAWEGGARLGIVDTLLLSSPSGIVQAAGHAFSEGTIWGDIGTSALEIVLGLLAAAVLGIVIGLLAGMNRWTFYAVDPWLTILYALPIVALAPLIIITVGVGLEAKVLLVFLFAVFPIAINAMTGAQATSNQYMTVAKIYGAGRLRTVRTVVLPGAAPFILTGIRLAGGRALVGMVVAEFTASNHGIGYLLNQAGATVQTGLLMFLLMLLGVAGVLYSMGIRRLEERFSTWRPDRRD